MYLVKLKSGHYIPYDNSDYELSGKVATGSVVKATAPRNYKFHKKAFALLNLGFDNQDKYDNFGIYRKIITIKAGYFDWVKGDDGISYPIPHSLSYENMSKEVFDKWYEDALNVISDELRTAPKEIEAELCGFY